MPFSNSSTTQKTLNLDQSITAAGQGVVLAPRHSGNVKGPQFMPKLGKGATLTINQGADAETLKESFTALGELLTKRPAQATPPPLAGADAAFAGAGVAGGGGLSGNLIGNALERRVSGTIEAGGEEAEKQIAGKLGAGNWALIIGGVIALFVAFWLKGRRHA